MTQQKGKGKSRASDPPVANNYDDVDWDAFNAIMLSDTGDAPPDTDLNDEDTTSDETDSNIEDVHGVDPFIVAQQVALCTRALPTSPCWPGWPAAYVIYNGVEMGVFESW